MALWVYTKMRIKLSMILKNAEKAMKVDGLIYEARTGGGMVFRTDILIFLLSMLSFSFAGCNGVNCSFANLYNQRFENYKAQLTDDERDAFSVSLENIQKIDTCVLWKIVLNRDIELLDLIVQHANNAITESQCDQMLLLSCDSDTMTRILSLVNCNPNKTLREDRLGDSVLSVHARHADCNSIDTLLKYFCDVNFRNRRGFSAAHFCAYSGSISNLKKLVEWNADIFVKSYSGKSLLHAASMRADDDVSFVEYLLSLGIDIDIQDAWGNTALFYAYSSNNKKILNCLLSAGAKTTIKNKDGFLYSQTKLKNLAFSIVY